MKLRPAALFRDQRSHAHAGCEEKENRGRIIFFRFRTAADRQERASLCHNILLFPTSLFPIPFISPESPRGHPGHFLFGALARPSGIAIDCDPC